MADFDYGANDFGGLDVGLGNYDISNFTGVPINVPTAPDPIYYENSGVGTTAGGEFIDPNNPTVLNDIAYQGDTTQPNNVSRNPNVSPADATRLINSDSSGLLKRLFTDKNGNLNLQALGGIGGGILGALGAMQPNVKKVGYQGGIPKYDAVRNMVNAPPTRAQGYRPGQGGINYGGDVSFVPRGTGASMAATQPSQDINRAPAGVAGQPGLAIGAASGIGGLLTGNSLAGLAGPGSADYIDRKNLLPPPPMSLAEERRIQDMRSKNLPIDSFLNPQRPATAQPISRDDPFYQSAEYKAFQNDPSNMTGTMDMYDSPYFGRMSSGSVGSAMDAAYEKYKNNSSGSAQPAPPASSDQMANAVQAAMGNMFNFAQGGLTNLARGRYLQGETDGMADKIPAKIGRDQPAALSHGEFVIPADVVSHLGNGNSDAGAKKLYSMMDKIRTARTGTKKQGKEINPDKFMPGGLAQAYAGGGEVKKFAGTTGSAVSGLGTAANAGVTGSETTPNTFAGEYIGDMLGKGQALANAPYQQYMGPLTAGESGLQSKVFGGLQNTNFPSNFGQSFSSTGAYQPPNLNMGAYNTQPIGTGPTPGMTLNQPGSTMMPAMEYGVPGSSTFGSTAQPNMMVSDMRYRPPGETADQGAGFNLPGLNNLFNQNMQAMTGLKNQGPAQRQTYDDYLKDIGDQSVVPQNREQFEAQQDQIDKMRSQGMDMLGRGNMSEIMAGLGGQPGQMPPSGMGGLAGLLGGMRQTGLDQNAINADPQGFAEFQRGAAEQERQRPGSTMFSYQGAQPQQPQGIASQYMNPYLQSVLDPQMAELRRQNDITNMMSNAKATGMGAFGGGRQAIMNAENNRNLMQEMNKTVGQGYATAFDKAQNQFNIEQGQGLSLANLMANQGTTQRNIEAEGIAADKAAFEAARENPYKMLQFQQSMLQGMPISATNIETATPTKLQQAMAGAGGLAGMFPVGSNPSMKDVSDLLDKLGLGSTPG